MKKQLLTLATAAAMTLTASAQSFSNYVCDPVPGEVTELSTIKITFTDFEDLGILQNDGIMLLHNYDEVELEKSDYKANTLIITCKETQTAGGEYTVCINDNCIEGYYDEYNSSMENPEPIMITYNIGGGTSGGEDVEFSFADYTVDPEEGEVTELSEITVTFPDTQNLDVNQSDMITVKLNGEDIKGYKTSADGDKTFTLKFSEPQTEAGNYVITLGVGSLTSANDDWSSWLDLESEIILHYTIAGEAETLDFSNVAMPLNGTITDELKEVSLTFPALAYVTADAAKTTVTVAGETLASDKYQIANPAQNSDRANTLVVTFTPSITATASTVVKISFEAGALSAVDNMDETKTGTNANPVDYVITVAPAAAEDLVFNLTGSTKPNADGEISADKQLDAFFFTVDMKGIEAVSGTEANVTVKENVDAEDAYSVSVRLEKGFGFNQNISYFTAKTVKEPKYNGTYTITIEANAVADGLWISNNMYGHTNAKQTLTFTLVDGKDRPGSGVNSISEKAADAIYNMQGVRINGSVDALPAGLYIINGKKVVK